MKAFISAKSPLPSMGWGDFIKQNEISTLINEIVASSLAIKEIINSPHYYVLTEYNVANLIHNYSDDYSTKHLSVDSLLEDFQFTVECYKFYSYFVFPKKLRKEHAKEILLSRDFYWFISETYNEHINDIKNNFNKKHYISSKLKEHYLHLKDLQKESYRCLDLANKGQLNYETWLKNKFDATAPFKENNYKFRARLKYQSHLLSYFLSSYEQLFHLFLQAVPHCIEFNPGRDTFTLEIAKYFLEHPSPERPVVKNSSIKKYYEYAKKIFELFDIKVTCNDLLLNYNSEFNWLKRSKYFINIKNKCASFRNFSTQLIKYNQELQKEIENATDSERIEIEREYDLVKSHMILPIFILNSLSIMEQQCNNLKLYEDIIANPEHRITKPKPNSYLDEINTFFINDNFFQNLPVNTTEIELEASSAISDVMIPEIEEISSDLDNVSHKTTTLIEINPVLPDSVPTLTSDSIALVNTQNDVSSTLQVTPPLTPIPPAPPIPSTFHLAHPAAASTSENKISFFRSIKVRKLIKELKDLGFDLNRQTGSHAILKLNNQQVVVPTSKDSLPRGTLNSIEERVNEIINNKKS